MHLAHSLLFDLGDFIYKRMSTFPVWEKGVWTFLIYRSSYIFFSISDQVSGFMSLISYTFVLLPTLLFKRHPMSNEEICNIIFVALTCVKHHRFYPLCVNSLAINFLCVITKYYGWFTAYVSFHIVTVFVFFCVIFVMSF